jgi:hypothetical protein
MSSDAVNVEPSNARVGIKLEAALSWKGGHLAFHRYEIRWPSVDVATRLHLN